MAEIGIGAVSSAIICEEFQNSASVNMKKRKMNRFQSVGSVCCEDFPEAHAFCMFLMILCKKTDDTEVSYTGRDT